MKLGVQTNSAVNFLMSASSDGPPVLPEVGDGATVLFWSDRAAATVIAVDKKKNIVTVRRDKAVLLGDSSIRSDGQSYDYAPNPDGAVFKFKFKGGRWRKMGWTLDGECESFESDKGWKLSDKKCYSSVTFGVRNEYYDHSF